MSVHDVRGAQTIKLPHQKNVLWFDYGLNRQKHLLQYIVKFNFCVEYVLYISSNIRRNPCQLTRKSVSINRPQSTNAF